MINDLRENTGIGNLIQIAVANPAMGAQWSQIVPDGYIWKVVAIKSTYTTGATGGNRVLRYIFTIGANFYLVATPSSQGNNLSYVYSGHIGITSQSLVVSGDILMALPSELYLRPGDAVGSSVVTVNGTEQFTNISLLVKQYNL